MTGRELPPLEPWQVPGWVDREALREHAETVLAWLAGPLAHDPFVLILRPVEHVDGVPYSIEAVYTRVELNSWQWAWPRADGKSCLVSWCAFDVTSGAVVAVGPTRLQRGRTTG